MLMPIIGHTFWRNRIELPLFLTWIFYFVLGVFFFLLFYLFLGDLFSKIIAYFRGKNTDINRRIFLGTMSLSAVNAVVGVVDHMRGPKIYNVDIPIKDLPQAFDGYRIIQISDLHVGPTIRKNYVENVRDMANTLHPDMVALTGDLLDGTPSSIEDDLSPLADLQTKDGTFFVSGNHEYYWNYPSWEKVFRKWGFLILENDSHTIIRGNDRLSIIGVPDKASKRFTKTPTNIVKAMEKVLPSDKKILLIHRPTILDIQNVYNIDLQLSGHTHGGQFFPWSMIITLSWRYYAGLNRHNNTWVYVNRGTGHWGPPLRSGIVAEITHITLKRS